jgi:hypothetical protein
MGVFAHSLITLLVMSAMLYSAAEATNIDLVLYDIGVNPTTVPVRSAVARDVSGSSNIYQLSRVGTFSAPYGAFDLPDGEFDIEISEPGYYHYKTRIQVGGSNETSVITWLVPVASGISILNHPLIGMTFPNMTFPHGVFEFDYASILPKYDGKPRAAEHNFGTAFPTPTFLNFPYLLTLSAAPAGTYRYYQEVYHWDFDGLELAPAILAELPRDENNYTSTSAKVSFFAGMDAETGFKGTYESRNLLAKTWYVADIISTAGTESGCINYNLQIVDDYSLNYGFDDGIDHGSGTPIHTECFDVSAPAQACTNLQYADNIETVTCGAFGDPHVIMFNTTGVTCGVDARSVLVDNEWFTLSSDNALLADGSGATAITGITFTYKGGCNPTTIRFSNTGDINADNVNSPVSGAHRMRIIGNNLYIDAIHLRLQARVISEGVMTFGISMPASLATMSSGICRDACPAGTQVSLDLPLSGKRSAERISMAQDACTDAGLSAGSFEYDACIFDVGLTGNADFAQSASQSVEVRNEVGESWTPPPEEPPSVTSPETPSAIPPFTIPPFFVPSTSSPTAQVPSPTPTGAASTLVPSVMGFMGLLVILL